MNSNPLASRSRRLLLLALLAAGCLLVAAPGALALPCEDSFTETVGSGWDTNANWSKGVTPSVEENVCLSAGSQVEIGPGVDAEASTVTGAVPLRIDAGGTLALAHEAQLQGANVVDGEIAGAAATVTLKSGTLAGTGTIGPRFINEAGTVEPGGDGVIGTLSFGGEYAQDEGARLDLDLASDSTFDRLQPSATSDALIYGTIAVRTLGEYVPTVGTTWDFITGSAGVTRGWTVTPTEFSAHSISDGAELQLDSALPSGPGGGEGEAPGGGTGGETPSGGSPESAGGSGGSSGSTAPGGSGNPGGSSGAAGANDPGSAGPGGSGNPGSPLAPGDAPAGSAGQCSATLVLRQAYLKGGHVIFAGTAPRSSAGKRVRILLGARSVAKATVRRDGAFHATARAPKKRGRASALYVAALGSVRSCGTRLKAHAG
jgi:hypothetical protein